ncbi:RHS repeat-associated core domain-containing protein [uncultured Pseudodesulfovibrio sp.]|uniref:RHS repeat domain-containing protein n=1 Tax=uncultured Pseudodesulfovibrio sp. TaxID=2035858 RepID=UPI0029C72DC5|nr:RHS repeat-associated core domain-containing protein [uncultured Pseudodesulfovibrio sp.]
MKNPYSYTLSHDPQGRIIEKTETVVGEPVKWTYAYDKAGRLAKCERNGWPVCDCWYDRAGRRACDSFPKSVEGDLRRYEYDMDNRLSRAGKNSYMHDNNGFRSMWNHKGKYTLYEYAPDYRLLKADQKDAGRTFTFRHDDEGRRIAKYCNGELVEAYEWLDFIRLAGYWDGRKSYEFAYEDGERTPYAMRRDDGAVAYLFHDQVGSLRVVADTSGNVIKAIQYDPFGGIIEDSNPGFAIPLGFAGGLHDRDLGFVRFGFRDYDTYTSRWTVPDPIGDAGGDSDWYGYCLDDPVNANDPLGLLKNEYGEKIPSGRSIVEVFADPLVSPFMSHYTKEKVQKGLRDQKANYTDENDWKMRKELDREADTYSKTKAFIDSYFTDTDEDILKKRINKAKERIGN